MSNLDTTLYNTNNDNTKYDPNLDKNNLELIYSKLKKDFHKYDTDKFNHYSNIWNSWKTIQDAS
jgi:hypothetical protein